MGGQLHSYERSQRDKCKSWPATTPQGVEVPNRPTDRRQFSLLSDATEERDPAGLSRACRGGECDADVALSTMLPCYFFPSLQSVCFSALAQSAPHEPHSSRTEWPLGPCPPPGKLPDLLLVLWPARLCEVLPDSLLFLMLPLPLGSLPTGCYQITVLDLVFHDNESSLQILGHWQSRDTSDNRIEATSAPLGTPALANGPAYHWP